MTQVWLIGSSATFFSSLSLDTLDVLYRAAGTSGACVRLILCGLAQGDKRIVDVLDLDTERTFVDILRDTTIPSPPPEAVGEAVV